MEDAVILDEATVQIVCDDTEPRLSEDRRDGGVARPGRHAVSNASQTEAPKRSRTWLEDAAQLPGLAWGRRSAPRAAPASATGLRVHRDVLPQRVTVVLIGRPKCTRPSAAVESVTALHSYVNIRARHSV
jgi:hypothetical protein